MAGVRLYHLRNLFGIASKNNVKFWSSKSTPAMVKSKIFLYVKPFEGVPKETDFKLVEEELPALKDGEFLSQALYLSVDPYMRRYSLNLSPGDVFIGTQVAKILESKNSKFPEGKYVVGKFGWRTHTISSGDTSDIQPEPYVLPDFGSTPLSLALGVLGMPGNTAYFGFLNICQPEKGNTVVVSGAAGAVGSTVGQIAKIKGCKVIGIAGSVEKGKWLLDDLGFDYFINYKQDDIDKILGQIIPNGFDCYYDNVGGDITTAVLRHLGPNARVSVVGSIAGYNDPTNQAGSFVVPPKVDEFRIERFRVYHPKYIKKWNEGIEQNLKWIQEGKLKYKETVTVGFENTPKAFISMLQGGNTGKAIIKV